MLRRSLGCIATGSVAGSSSCLVLLGLAAVVAAIATTPVGQDWWRDIQDWCDEAYAWVKGQVS